MTLNYIRLWISTWENEFTLCRNYPQVTLEQGVVPVCIPQDFEILGWHTVEFNLPHGCGRQLFSRDRQLS